MNTSKRIELEQKRIEIRGRMSQLRAMLTATPNSPDVQANLTMQLRFFAQFEQILQKKLQLERIEGTILEMRQMISKGLSAVPTPSFRTRLLALYDETRRRDKLRAMMENEKRRKAALRKQIRYWETKELPHWEKMITKIEDKQSGLQTTATEGRRQLSESQAMIKASRRPPKRLELKAKIAELKARDPEAPSRKICESLDALVERGRKGLQPLESWTKEAKGKRSWSELYDHASTRNLVRTFINKVPAVRPR